MNSTETLAEIRAKTIAASEHVFHASLPLYVLVEKRPRPDNPDWVEVGCWLQDGAEGMMVYLSPIDAMIDINARNRSGRRFAIFPFEAVDPRHFIQEHAGWLTVYLVYGFAARRRRLILSNEGELLPLTKANHFQITPEMKDHFHLNFHADAMAWLERMHVNAGMHDYAQIVRDLADASTAETVIHAHEALQRVKSPERGTTNITDCGLYDPVEQQWRFASFADMALER